MMVLFFNVNCMQIVSPMSEFVLDLTRGEDAFATGEFHWSRHSHWQFGHAMGLANLTGDLHHRAKGNQQVALARQAKRDQPSGMGQIGFFIFFYFILDTPLRQPSQIFNTHEQNIKYKANLIKNNNKNFTFKLYSGLKKLLQKKSLMPQNCFIGNFKP